MRLFSLRIFGFRVAEVEEIDEEDGADNREEIELEVVKRVRDFPRVVCDGCGFGVSLVEEHETTTLDYVAALGWLLVGDDLSLASRELYCVSCAEKRS